ncbi:hypothetical protein F3Y22_tig00112649pilonHSYRG00076 [Hibiscus syriacus]|uniref:Uncharacterized protein n=1 Tax=Hibiscus syriacus TaxID=106335 RepID=A0A6A2X7V6_HIBSY|nr:hypothetical protein F3Y22_tig00112649pilonHSYRG00076 [Hibiscus syriacus]
MDMMFEEPDSTDPGMVVYAPPIASDDSLLAYSNTSDNGHSLFEANRLSGKASPLTMSPWNQTTPTDNSSWDTFDENGLVSANSLIGSLMREEGHIYSLAARNELLYTGSDSKLIRVWKNLNEFSGFKSNSGLVKAVVISGEKIFTGHQDGKIRVWKVWFQIAVAFSVISFFTAIAAITGAIRCYCGCSICSRRQRYCEIAGAIAVWRISDFKCLESVQAHDDAVNAVIVSLGEMVFTDSADGTVKFWKRDQLRKGTKHTLAQTLIKQECAVTALTVITSASPALYCGSSDG